MDLLNHIALGSQVLFTPTNIFFCFIGVLMGTLLFHVPFRGSYLLLVILSALFLTGALSQGILISIVAKTQIMASQLASISTMIPALLLSGFIYPIFNMPQALQLVTYLIPARYYIFILRSLFLKGVGLEVLWHEAVFLFLFAFFMIMLAMKKFKKKVA